MNSEVFFQLLISLSLSLSPMEKDGISSRVAVLISSVIFFVLILTLHQDSLFSTSTFNSWNQGFWNRRTSYPSSEKSDESIQKHLKRLVRGEDLTEFESTGLSCTYDEHFEQCVISKPVIFDKRSLTIYVSSDKPGPPLKRVVKPYARREDQGALNGVAPFNILKGNINQIQPPKCEFQHNEPAMVFSFGGLSHNLFHAFNEIIIPLFITSHHFEKRVKFVIIDYRPRWIRKFIHVLKKLTDYEFVDADSDDSVHCFPAAVVGLRYHENLAVNSSTIPKGLTMQDFKHFLRESYKLKTESITPLTNQRKPRLLLLSRPESRRLLNEDEIVKMMEKLEFQVQRALPKEMSYLDKFANTVNSCDVMVGVHGAGLTNQIFLPNGSVLVQIAPLGLEWACEHFYAGPTAGGGLKYLEYKVWPNETSLYDQYGPDDPVISDPASVWAKGYGVVKDVYLDHQDFRIDLNRFKETLLEVLRLLR